MKELTSPTKCKTTSFATAQLLRRVVDAAVDRSSEAATPAKILKKEVLKAFHDEGSVLSKMITDPRVIKISSLFENEIKTEPFIRHKVGPDLRKVCVKAVPNQLAKL